jgi:hypothetical protein
MANLLHLGGRYMNNLARAVSPIFSLTPGSDANFPNTALYDSIQDVIWKASANTALAIVVDQNLIPGGNLDTWSAGLPSPLTGPTAGPWFTILTGTATALQTSVAGEVVTGSAVKLTAGTGVAMLAIPLIVRAGETLTVTLALRGDGGNNARVQVYNRHSGNYFNGVSTWSSSSATFVTAVNIPTSGAAYVTGTFTIPVESFLACGTETPTIELRLASSSAAGIAYFDNVFVWPSSTFLGVFGHNIDPGASLAWYGSQDGAATTLRTTPPPYKPSFYASDAGGQSTVRYQHLVAANTNAGSGTPWMGELVLGQHLALARQANYPIQVTQQFPQLRSYSASGAKRSAPLSLYERRSLQLVFRYGPKSEYQEARDRIFRATMGGHYPSVIVPDDTDPEHVQFGYMSMPWGPVSQWIVNLWDAPLFHEEEPHPIITA